MQNTCCICGTENENLETRKIFRPYIHKWAAPFKKIPDDIYESDCNNLPMCKKCERKRSAIPLNKAEIRTLYVTEEERAGLLKLYQRLSEKICTFNRIFFKIALLQENKCDCCGAVCNIPELTLHRKDHEVSHSVHNAVLMCKSCAQNSKKSLTT